MKHLYLQPSCINNKYIMKLTLEKPDNIGALASTLCMIHCFATPFIFIAQSCATTCCASAPEWWIWIDYIFLAISFFAIYRSTKTTSKQWIKSALWISWILLVIIILNERIALIHLPEIFKYITASSLVVLHLYNRKYCQCKEDECCVK